VVYRGWIRGGANAHVDDRRVMEQWLLDTGEATSRRSFTPNLRGRSRRPSEGFFARARAIIATTVCDHASTFSNQVVASTARSR